tara:strand:- start:910 stop:1086 length:177 start_codon:yes stop_codon:yes gene_type:complete
MNDLYSIDEILNAVDELQNKKTKRVVINQKKSIKNQNEDIPQNTLKLIEEAEKTINKS